MLKSEILIPGEYSALPKWVLQDPTLGIPAKLVLMALIDRLGENDTCYPGFGRIAKDCGIDRSTTIHAVEELIERGFLIKEKGKRPSNLYQIVARNHQWSGATSGAEPLVTSGEEPLGSGAEPLLIVARNHPNYRKELPKELPKGGTTEENASPPPTEKALSLDEVGLLEAERRNRKLPPLLRAALPDSLAAYNQLKAAWKSAGLPAEKLTMVHAIKTLLFDIMQEREDFLSKIDDLCMKVKGGKFLRTQSIFTILKRMKGDQRLFNYEAIIAGQWDDREDRNRADTGGNIDQSAEW